MRQGEPRACPAGSRCAAANRHVDEGHNSLIQIKASRPVNWFRSHFWGAFFALFISPDTKRRLLDGGVPVKTAAEYRAMAEECFTWAREAHDNDVRSAYLQLAQVWLDAASKRDGLPATRIAPAADVRKGGLAQNPLPSPMLMHKRK